MLRSDEGTTASRTALPPDHRYSPRCGSRHVAFRPGRGDIPRLPGCAADPGRAARRGSASTSAGAAGRRLPGHLEASQSAVAGRTRHLTPPELAVEVSACLQDAGIQHAIGGAIAFGFHAEPRGTLDVDMTVFVAATRPRQPSKRWPPMASPSTSPRLVRRLRLAAVFSSRTAAAASTSSSTRSHYRKPHPSGLAKSTCWASACLSSRPKRSRCPEAALQSSQGHRGHRAANGSLNPRPG